MQMIWCLIPTSPYRAHFNDHENFLLVYKIKRLKKSRHKLRVCILDRGKMVREKSRQNHLLKQVDIFNLNLNVSLFKLKMSTAHCINENVIK